MAAYLVVAICAAALLGADEPKPTTRDSAVDTLVLQTVFDDMLSKENTEFNVEWKADQSKSIYVLRTIPNRRPAPSDVLSRHDAKKWNALKQAERMAATEAAGNLFDRAGAPGSLPELKSTSGRVKFYEDTGAATQPSRGNPIGERYSTVFLPGYSNDGRYAVVHLGFPWSGMMHSGVATYILERTQSGWKVILRDFIYYL